MCLLITLPVSTTKNIKNYSMINESFTKTQIDDLYKDITNNRIYLGENKINKFDNKTFYSTQDLNEYILKNNFVEMELTSSNPLKIIKNYEHMILDDKKIYDIDINNFKRIYRDAFGNIAMTKEQALNTYANLGNVKPKYSFDGELWFDTPDEAKINEKYNLKINKSLYYIYNNQYYNAFNPVDINALVSKFTPGYFLNKSSAFNDKDDLVNLFGTSSEIYEKLKRNSAKDFYSTYYKKVLDLNSKYTLSISPKKNYRMTVQCDGGSVDYDSNDKVLLKMMGNKKYISWNSFKSDFQNGWHEEYEGIRPVLTKTFDFNYKNKDCKQGKINLLLESYKGTPTFFDDFHYTDETETVFTGYFKNKKGIKSEIWKSPKMRHAYTTDDIGKDLISLFYDKWFTKYFNSIQDFKDPNAIFSFENLKNNILDYNSDGSIAKDLLYEVNGNLGYKNSLIKSYKEFLSIKERILKKSYQVDGKTKYKMREDLYITKKQLDNFLPLQGNFNAILKYSYGSNEDIISRDGKFLADTLEEAKEKEMINKKRILKKQFLVYDAFGNIEISGENEKTALKKLYNNILLTSKFVHREESDQWNKNFKLSYDNIISDGRYAVYKIKDPNNKSKFIYYPSQELAIDAVKSSVSNINNIDTLTRKTYLYSYQTRIGQTIPILIYDNDINSAISKIKEIESSHIK